MTNLLLHNARLIDGTGAAGPIDDLRVTLLARNRYRHHTGAGR